MKRIVKSIRNILSIVRLCGNFSSAIYAIPLYLVLSMNRWFGQNPEFTNYKQISIDLHGKRFNFYIKRQLDFDVLRDTFVDNLYEIQENLSPKYIVDFGSNIGTTVLKFHAQYPDANIYAFEPDPRNFESLKLNSELLDGKVAIDSRAVSDISGKEIPFYTGTKHHWSSSFVKRPERQVEKIHLVTTVTIDDIMKEYELPFIDILKCDIEGAECLAFRTFQNISMVKFVVGEFHPSLSNCTWEEFISFFPEFEILKLNKTNWVFLLRNKSFNQLPSAIS